MFTRSPYWRPKWVVHQEAAMEKWEKGHGKLDAAAKEVYLRGKPAAPQSTVHFCLDWKIVITNGPKHAAACRSMPQHAAACRSMPQHAAACRSMPQRAAKMLDPRWCLLPACYLLVARVLLASRLLRCYFLVASSLPPPPPLHPT